MEQSELTAITAVIERARGKLSVRKAAEAAGISEGRWRQIAKGYQSAAGMRIPVSTTPETLARMAAVAGVTEAQLREIGADDVADAVRTIRSREQGVGLTLDFDRYEAALQQLTKWLTPGNEDLHPPTTALWLWSPLQLSIALSEQVEVLEQAFTQVDRERYRLLLRGKALPRDDEKDTPEESDEHERRAPANRPVGSAPTDPFTTALADASALFLAPGPTPTSRPDTGAHRTGRP